MCLEEASWRAPAASPTLVDRITPTNQKRLPAFSCFPIATFCVVHARFHRIPLKSFHLEARQGKRQQVPIKRRESNVKFS
jgi:hypothetical protein